jgi:hypothetical protein
VRGDVLRVRAIWCGIAALVALLAAADLALSRFGAGHAAFVPGCTGCHDGTLAAVPGR